MKTYFTYFKYLNFLACSIVISFGLLPSFSFAKNKENYRPPQGKVRHQARKAGGSRGCNTSNNNTITLLVPQNHTATTVSEYPTFFWELSSSVSLPIRFTLLEPGQPPIYTKELNPQPGIIALKIPQNTSPLEVGKTYRWTVTIICNPKKPSRNIFTQAWIERVAIPKSNFSVNTNSNSEFCSLTYAKAGIWYDALACNYTQLAKERNNFDTSEFWSLLEQIKLSDVVDKKPAVSLY